MRLLLFGKEQFVNPYHDYFDDHVSRNGEQDAQQTEEIAAYKDEGNRGQRVNIKLFPVDDRCQNIILDLLCDDNNDNGPYRNGRRFDKSDNDGRNGRQQRSDIRDEIQEKEMTVKSKE